MSFLDLFVIAVGLSMDAFAVSVCKGLSVRQLKFSHACTAGAYFGGFQFLMPLLGYALGVRFQQYITSIDHWIAFVLLALIGANMIKESRGEAEQLNDSFSFWTMLPLAVATSIDALAVGRRANRRSVRVRTANSGAHSAMRGDSTIRRCSHASSRYRASWNSWSSRPPLCVSCRRRQMVSWRASKNSCWNSMYRRHILNACCIAPICACAI